MRLLEFFFFQVSLIVIVLMVKALGNIKAISV